MISEIICASVDFRRYRKILDVGGGIGIFARHAAESATSTTVAVFDLPEVINVLESGQFATERGAPIEVIGGDFFQDNVMCFRPTIPPCVNSIVLLIYFWTLHFLFIHILLRRLWGFCGRLRIHARKRNIYHHAACVFRLLRDLRPFARGWIYSSEAKTAHKEDKGWSGRVLGKVP